MTIIQAMLIDPALDTLSCEVCPTVEYAMGAALDWEEEHGPNTSYIVEQDLNGVNYRVTYPR